MTDRELRRLRRAELLEMMIENRQAADAAEERAALAEEQKRRIEEANELLRKKLDDRDEEIRTLIAELRSRNNSGEAGEGP